MDQMSFGDGEYASKRKRTRREAFLTEMEQVIPWAILLNLIEPVYPKAGNGRRPYPLKVMLKIHLMQNWFGLSDPAMEEALYEIASMRQFAGLSLTKPIPDETTILRYRPAHWRPHSATVHRGTDGQRNSWRNFPRA